MSKDTPLSGSDRRIIAHLLEVEGWPAFTNDPDDRGSATKGGITLATLSAHRGRPCTVAELQALPQSEAEAIYRQRFITGPRFDRVEDELLRWQLVDASVLSGPARVTRWLQEAAGILPADGILGSKTTAAVNATSAHRLGLRVAALRAEFLGRLIEADRTQAKYAAGWMVRAMRFIELESDRAA